MKSEACPRESATGEPSLHLPCSLPPSPTTGRLRTNSVLLLRDDLHFDYDHYASDPARGTRAAQARFMTCSTWGTVASAGSPPQPPQSRHATPK